MIGLLTALILATPPSPQEVVDWPSLVARVQASSPLMAEARAGLERFEAALKSAQWSHFPVLELNAHFGLGPEGGALEASATQEERRWGDTYRFGVTLEQPLYTFGKLAGLKAAARHGVEAGQALVQVARWELISRAAHAYQGALVAREVAFFLRDGRRWVDKVNARLEELRLSDDEAYDPLVHLRLKSRLGELAQMESDNAALLSESEDALRLLLSQPAEAPLQLGEEGVSFTPFALKPLEVYLAMAKARRPEVKAAEARVLAQEALTEGAKASLLPDLLLVGEFNALGSETLERPLALPGQGSVGMAAGFLLALRWRFDARSSFLRGEELDARARQLRARAAESLQTLEAEVRRLYGRLARQGALVEAKGEAAVAARSWLANAWELYDTGFGKLPEVMDALEQLWVARIGELRSRAAYNLMVIALSRAVGEDLTQAQGAER